MLGLCCCVDFSLVVVSGGYSLVVVWELLIAVAFVVEYRLEGTQASVVVALQLSCSMTCGIFLDQGSNAGLLHCQADCLPLNHQGSSHGHF